MNTSGVFKKGILLASVSFVVIFFQNCSQDVAFKTTSRKIASDMLSSAGIVINENDELTADSKVSLTLFSDKAEMMYVTNDSSCKSGGNWEQMNTKKSWILSQLNANSSVYVKFRNIDGVATDCINDSILHDAEMPYVQFVDGPGVYSNQKNVSVRIKAIDNVSGINTIECSHNNQENKKCMERIDLSITNEGANSLKVVASDKAGNKSQPVQLEWVSDFTPPVISFEKMQLVSTSLVVPISFSASDNGSGIESLNCFVDEKLYQKNCDKNLNINFTSQGLHSFYVVAMDKAGNMTTSNPLKITIDSVPPKDFQILGVSGQNDSEVDAYLSHGDTSPIVHWTQSVDAITYIVRVKDSNGNTVCTAQVGNVLKAALNCNLVDGQTYSTQVIAQDSYNNSYTSNPFAFMVDSGVSVDITSFAVFDKQYSASFEYNVIETGSGLESLTCVKKDVKTGDEVVNDCAGTAKMDYISLALGEYQFIIKAKDKAGNMAEDVQDFNVSPIICNPLAGNLMDESCDTVKGIKAQLYYLDSAPSTADRYVDYYIENGNKVNAKIYFNQLFVPTRNYTEGFSAGDSNRLTDSSGKTLIEYFALDMNTFIQLGENDPEGEYQLAVLSDDGSTIHQINEDGSIVSVIDNDNNHSTKLGCYNNTGSVQTITMKKGKAVPLRIRYFQGPRTEISLTLLWRKLGTNNEYCNTSSSSAFFGEDVVSAGGSPEFDNPDTLFNKLTDYKYYTGSDPVQVTEKHEWKVVGEDNLMVIEPK